MVHNYGFLIVFGTNNYEQVVAGAWVHARVSGQQYQPLLYKTSNQIDQSIETNDKYLQKADISSFNMWTKIRPLLLFSKGGIYIFALGRQRYL